MNSEDIAALAAVVTSITTTQTLVAATLATAELTLAVVTSAATDQLRAAIALLVIAAATEVRAAVASATCQEVRQTAVPEVLPAVAAPVVVEEDK